MNNLCERMSHMGTILVLCLLAYSFTPLAVSNINASENNKLVTSGCEYDYPPLCIVKKTDNKADGFSVELLRESLSCMGYDVKFQTGQWDKIKNLLRVGTIDVLPLVGRTPEREHFFDFTFPYLTLHGTIVVRKETDHIHTLGDMRNKKIAVMKGDNAEEFMRRMNVTDKIVTTRTFKDALINLSNGMYDAVVIQYITAASIIEKNKLTNLRTAGRPLSDFKQSFCFAVKEGNKDLLAILNEGLSIKIADGTFQKLYTKWFSEFNKFSKSRIVMGGKYDYPPYSFLNDNDQPVGYNVDIAKAIAKETGLDIDIHLGPWSEIMDDLKNNRIDVIQGMFYSKERDKHFDFSQAHSVIPHVFVIRKNHGFMPESIKDVHNKKVIVMTADIMNEFALEHGLDERNLILAENIESVLKTLASGKGDCAMVARLPALYYIRKDNLENLIVSDQPIISPEYCFAIIHGDTTILNTITEGLSIISETGEYKRIQDKWLGVYKEKSVSFWDALKYTMIVIIPLVILLIGFYLWNQSLKLKVEERTSILKDEISERKKIEEQLRDSEERYRAVVEDQTEYICRFKKDGTITWVNDALLKFMGMTSSEKAIGLNFLSFLDKDAQKKAMESIESITYENPLNETTQCNKLKNNKKIFIEWRNRGIFNDKKELVEIQGVGRDISEQKLLEEELIQSEKLKAIGQLAGGIAHDFNNQLGGILGYAEMLLQRLTDEKLIHYAQSIQNGAERAADLTCQLLAFGRKGNYLSITVNIHDILEEVITILNHTIDKRIKIIKNFKAHPPLTLGDPAQIQSIFLNLALNARDAMPEGGELSFETEIKSLDNYFCKSHPYEIIPGEYICIQVTDTGTGMSEEIMAHLFEPFFTTKDLGKGTGMGLASVYGAIRNHKGAITVYSELNIGSVFKIYLQVCEKTQMKNVPVKAPASKGTASILIIDDEEISRNIARDMLGELGYSVTLCENGKKAIDYYKTEWKKIDVIVLDMIMPDMSGSQTYDVLKSINPDLKVVVASGYSLSKEVREILDSGISRYVGKPFRQNELAAAIEEIVSK